MSLYVILLIVSVLRDSKDHRDSILDIICPGHCPCALSTPDVYCCAIDLGRARGLVVLDMMTIVCILAVTHHVTLGYRTRSTRPTHHSPFSILLRILATDHV